MAARRDVYAKHVNAAGIARWTANGTLICGAVAAGAGVYFARLEQGGMTRGARVVWME